MPRQRFLFIVAFALLLSACSLTKQPSTPLLISTPVSTGTYDGSWMGKGITQNGDEVDIHFIIKDSVVNSFIYTYTSQEGSRCTNLHYDNVSPASYSKVSNGTFSFSLSSTLSFTGKLNTDTSASGTLTFVETDAALRYGCAANFDVHWTATKLQTASAASATPVTSSWCGKNINCNDLLFQLLIFGLVNGAILALSAIGITVIYSTVRILNLAHGDVFALITVFVTSAINIIGLNLDWTAPTRVLTLGLVFVGAVAIGALLSVIVEALAFRPFRGRSKLAPLIASLGLSFILYQGSLVWRTFQRSFIRGEHRSVPGLNEVPTDGIPNFFPTGNLLHGRVVFQYSDAFVLVIGLLFVLITMWILQRTQLGRSIRAVAQNEELAQIVGVNRDGAIRRAF
ncbi:MAG TPA: branched-chain amino acid ABC transporter permease, partial [Anaerolineales bacterium]